MIMKRALHLFLLFIQIPQKRVLGYTNKKSIFSSQKRAIHQFLFFLHNTQKRVLGYTTKKPMMVLHNAHALRTLLFIAFLGIYGIGWGQSASSTWALTSNATSSVTGNVTSVNQTGGSGIGAMSYGTNGVSSTGWGSAGLNVNDYYQFSISPTTSNSLNVSSISTTNNLSSQTATGQIRYSFSSTFTSPVDVGTTFSISSTSNTTTFSSLSIDVSSGQTLYIRIYVYKGSGNTITDSQTVRCSTKIIIYGTT
jgi:hypothetical protein